MLTTPSHVDGIDAGRSPSRQQLGLGRSELLVGQGTRRVQLRKLLDLVEIACVGAGVLGRRRGIVRAGLVRLLRLVGGLVLPSALLACVVSDRPGSSPGDQ